MRYAFAGTPDFGALVLESLLVRASPVLVVSQPARPFGRGQRPTASPVATLARANHLPLLETADINQPESVEALLDSRVDVLVVAAFGQMVRPHLLATLECINVHASLLPSYRGAAPIPRALMDGADQTGVCIMKMTEGLDEGPVGAAAAVSLELWDDAGTVGRALALRGAQATAHVLDAMSRGDQTWVEQQGSTSYAAKLTAGDRELDLTASARVVHDRVRALHPGPGAVLRSGDLELKIWRTWPRDASEDVPVCDRPGAIGESAGRLFVGCRLGCLEILELQASGKKRVAATEFLRGYSSRLRDIVWDRGVTSGRDTVWNRGVESDQAGGLGEGRGGGSNGDT